MSPTSYRLGVDVGGTFTDLLLLREDTGETWRAKVPSTPEDQSLAVIQGKDQILSNLPDGSTVILNVVNHGTTVGTNTILEQKGAKVALVVTEGYRDIFTKRVDLRCLEDWQAGLYGRNPNLWRRLSLPSRHQAGWLPMGQKFAHLMLMSLRKR